MYNFKDLIFYAFRIISHNNSCLHYEILINRIQISTNVILNS